jgi:hypothetical protein
MWSPPKYLPSKILFNIVITLLWMPSSNKDETSSRIFLSMEYEKPHGGQIKVDVPMMAFHSDQKSLTKSVAWKGALS